MFNPKLTAQDIAITQQIVEGMTNPVPKEAFGEKALAAYNAKAAKMRPLLLPIEAIIEGTKAMEFGAQKYGPEQWRTADISEADIKNALFRHLLDYLSGETHAQDSKAHHLGHIIANCGILLARFEKK